MGSLLHISFAIWNVIVISPFGSSNKLNTSMKYLYLGAIFAILYTIIVGLWDT